MKLVLLLKKFKLFYHNSAYEGYITVKYEKLTALLIEAVKAQQQQIDELKRLVAAGRGI